MNNPEYILTDVFKGLAANATVNLASVLAAISASAQVNFFYGYVTELNTTLDQLSKSAPGVVKKYPFIWLEQPYTVNRGIANWYGSTTLRLFLVMESNVNYKAADRMQKVYKPILYPIYRELMKQIHESPVFISPGLDRIPHLKTDYYYFSDPTGKKAVFSDVVDCLCISGLKLNINSNPNCN